MVALLEGGLLLGLLGLAIVGLMLAGRWIGRRRLARDPERGQEGVAAVEGAVFALLGLLIAFSFSGAWARFDARRELLLQEANAIGTAHLRLDLLAPRWRDELRAAFRRYVDLRLAATRARLEQADATIEAVQRVIWSRAVAAAQAAPDPRVAQLLLPSLNEMFDVATARYVAMRTHAPRAIFVVLVLLTLGGALLAGYGMAPSRRPSWTHILCFASSLILAIYLTVEIEFPRRGLIRIDHFDQLLQAVRAGMR